MNPVLTSSSAGFGSVSIATMRTFFQFTKNGYPSGGSLSYLNNCLADPDAAHPAPDIKNAITSCLFNDPCAQSPFLKAENFECNAGVECAPNTDCFDCDTFQQYKNSCATCTENGGRYCEFTNGASRQGVCSSPDIAATVPTFCSSRTSGTAYSCKCPGSTATATCGGGE
jgi:hypothetical protein